MKEPIVHDFNVFEKQIKKREILNNIKSKKKELILDEISAIMTSFSISNGKILQSIIFSGITLYGVLYLLQLSYENKKNIQYEIEKAIRKTDSYKKCIEEYKSYQEKLSLFINNKLGITDGLMVAKIFNNMLEDGLLSYNNNHCFCNYPLYEHYYDLPELYGCRIATGSSVCRHRSAFIVDLEQAMNNEAYYALNFPVNKEKIFNDNPDFSEYFLCHAVSILKDNENTLYAFDPVINSYNNQLSILQDKQGIEYITYPEGNNIYCIPTDHIFSSYKLNEPVSVNITIKQDEIRINKLNLSKNTYKDLKDECNQFYLNTKNKLGIIKETYEEIVPLTTKKLSKHIIR